MSSSEYITLRTARCCSPDEDERLNADFLAAATYLSCGDERDGADLVVLDDSVVSHRGGGVGRAHSSSSSSSS